MVRIGFEEVFGTVLERVSIRVIAERAAAPGLLQSIIEAVAVGIGAVGIGAEGGFLVIGESVAIAIRRRRGRRLAMDLNVIALAISIGIGEGGIQGAGGGGAELVAIGEAISIAVRVLRVQ